MSISPLKTLDRIRKDGIEYLIVELGVENGVPTVGCIPVTNQIVYFPAENITLSNDDEAARRSLPHYMRSKIAKEIPPVITTQDTSFDNISDTPAVGVEPDQMSVPAAEVQEKRKRDDEPTFVDMADGLVYVIEQLETEGVLDIPLLKSIYADLKRFNEEHPDHPERMLLFGAENQIDAVIGVAAGGEDAEKSVAAPYRVKDETFILSLIDDIGKTQKTLSEIE